MSGATGAVTSPAQHTGAPAPAAAPAAPAVTYAAPLCAHLAELLRAVPGGAAEPLGTARPTRRCRVHLPHRGGLAPLEAEVMYSGGFDADMPPDFVLCGATAGHAGAGFFAEKDESFARALRKYSPDEPRALLRLVGALGAAYAAHSRRTAEQVSSGRVHFELSTTPAADAEVHYEHASGTPIAVAMSIPLEGGSRLIASFSLLEDGAAPALGLLVPDSAMRSLVEGGCIDGGLSPWQVASRVLPKWREGTCLAEYVPAAAEAVAERAEAARAAALSAELERQEAEQRERERQAAEARAAAEAAAAEERARAWAAQRAAAEAAAAPAQAASASADAAAPGDADQPLGGGTNGSVVIHTHASAGSDAGGRNPPGVRRNPLAVDSGADAALGAGDAADPAPQPPTTGERIADMSARLGSMLGSVAKRVPGIGREEERVRQNQQDALVDDMLMELAGATANTAAPLEEMSLAPTLRRTNSAGGEAREGLAGPDSTATIAGVAASAPGAFAPAAEAMVRAGGDAGAAEMSPADRGAAAARFSLMLRQKARR